MKKQLKQVEEFHKTFGQPVVNAPVIPAEERSKLRLDLLKEELGELEKAILDNDLVEVADALADLQYVLLGTVIEFGFSKKFEDIFNEVQRSNMSKACDSLEEAEGTIKKYRDERAMFGYLTQRGDKFIVYRRGDDKVLKSVNYSPADIKKFL